MSYEISIKQTPLNGLQCRLAEFCGRLAGFETIITKTPSPWVTWWTRRPSCKGAGFKVNGPEFKARTDCVLRYPHTSQSTEEQRQTGTDYGHLGSRHVLLILKSPWPPPPPRLKKNQNHTHCNCVRTKGACFGFAVL